MPYNPQLAGSAERGFQTGVDIASQWKRQALEQQLQTDRNAFLDRQLKLDEAKFELEKQQIMAGMTEFADTKDLRSRALQADVSMKETGAESAKMSLEDQSSPAAKMAKQEEMKSRKYANDALAAQTEQTKAQTEQMKAQAAERQQQLQQLKVDSVSKSMNNMLPTLAMLPPEQRKAQLARVAAMNETGALIAGLLQPFVDLQVSPGFVKETQDYILNEMQSGAISSEVGLKAMRVLQDMEIGKLSVDTVSKPGQFGVPQESLEIIGATELGEIMRRRSLQKAPGGMTTEQAMNSEKKTELGTGLTADKAIDRVRPEKLVEDLVKLRKELTSEEYEKLKVLVVQRGLNRKYQDSKKPKPSSGKAWDENDPMAGLGGGGIK